MNKLSIAFALNRKAITVELSQLLAEQALPEWNAAMENIRRLYEDESHNTKVGEALAMHRKRARVADARAKRQLIIESLNSQLKEKLEAKVKEYGGTVESKEDILVAKFPDNTIATMPRGLWVNYRMFPQP